MALSYPEGDGAVAITDDLPPRDSRASPAAPDRICTEGGLRNSVRATNGQNEQEAFTDHSEASTVLFIFERT